VQVGGQWVGGCEDLVSGLDLDGAVWRGLRDELPDRPAGPIFDPAADRQGGVDYVRCASIESRRWW
jgi:hypothetical protein